MPLNFNFIERFPIPSLRNYAGFSAILLSAILYYSYDTVVNDEIWQVEFKQKIVDQGLSGTTRDWLVSSTLARIIYFMLTDQVCIWTVVNTACCTLVLIGKLLQTVVFGRLRIVEHQQMRDRFWNFVFYKFVFVFGVMNVQYFDEVFMWSIWFALCGFFYLLTSLAQDRFKYISSSPSAARSSYLRILVFLSVILFCDLGLFGVAAAVTVKYGVNYGGFLAAECIMLLLRVGHGLLRYGAYFYDAKRRVNWEERNALVYYTDLAFELLILITDFGHHLHMLIWSNIFLSMASLVICMQLKHLYQEIDRRLRRHRNYQRIAKYIDSKYPMATLNDLNKHDDKCAICWDQMKTARKLTCGHLFHNWCLHGWLEQDTSCPTCRTALSITPPVEPGQGNVEPGVGMDIVDDAIIAQRRRLRTNHFFHFDGRRYARWLPSFSVEVSHNLSRPSIFRRNQAIVGNSQLTRMADQVREMFPNLPSNLIEQDLRDTSNLETTIDNILNGRLNAAGDEFNIGADVNVAGSDVETESEYESDGLSGESFSGHESRDTENGLPGGRGLTEEELLNSILTLPAEASSVPCGANGRFSKSTEEREVILDTKRRQLIHEHRRKYLNSSRADDLREMLKSVQQQKPTTLTPEPAQSLVLSAVGTEAQGDAFNNATNQKEETPLMNHPPLANQNRSGILVDDGRARRRMLYNAALRHLPSAASSGNDST